MSCPCQLALSSTLEMRETGTYGKQTTRSNQQDGRQTLRHKPERLGLTLESGGWVAVTALLGAWGRKGFALSRSELEEVVRRNDKQRFAFDESGTHIRASQGHSVDIDLGLTALEPPELPFHGTTSAALESGLNTGLQRMSRHHVHLSTDQETVQRGGSRHASAVILRVAALGTSEVTQFCIRSSNTPF